MIAIGTFTRSSSFRVGALFTLLSSAAMAFIIYFWSLANEDTLLGEARAAINARMWGYVSIYKLGGERALLQAVNQNDNGGSGLLLYLEDSQGRYIAGNLTSTEHLRPPADSDFFQFTINDEATDKRAVVFRQQQLENGMKLFVARDINELYTAQWIGQSLSWVFVVVLGCISGLSFGVAIYVVNRINRMSSTADSIMQTGNLTERLAIDSNWDDLSKLAVMFNRMLDKIESSVRNIKSVTDNIAHDLRTPLTRMRSKLDRLPDSELKYEAQAEAENLLGMFNGLLRIADIESKRQKEGFAQLDLADVVSDVVDLYEPYIEEHHMALSFNINKVVMRGDSNLLFQVVANLLDNAVKYAGDGAHIRVETGQTNKRFYISVNDSGLGVDATHFEQLDRRFYRAQSSRTTAGNGLGLSMVKAVCDLHDGNLYYVIDPLCQQRGLGVTLTFPKPLLVAEQ